MVLLGISAGMFVVPVQVYLQQAPPADLKGRVIGVQNFMTWIGILLSAGYVAAVGMIQVRIGGEGAEGPLQWIMFGSLAVFMLPICLFYRLPSES
jgi:MFS family permease